MDSENYLFERLLVLNQELTENIAFLKFNLNVISVEKHKILQSKFFIVSLYSLWEGYFRVSVGLYLDYIYSLSLDFSSFNSSFKFFYFEYLAIYKIKELTIKNSSDYFEIMNKKVEKPNTSNGENSIVKSNLDEKTLLEITKLLSISINLKNNHSNLSTLLTKFMAFRHKFAHGDLKEITISSDDVSKYSNLIFSLSDLLTEEIQVSVKSKSFLA